MVRYRSTGLLHVFSHELGGKNQESFDSTFSENVSFLGDIIYN